MDSEPSPPAAAAGAAAAAGPLLPIACRVLGGQVCLFSAHAALWLQQHGHYGTPAFGTRSDQHAGGRRACTHALRALSFSRGRQPPPLVSQLLAMA
eukprot:SAG22_NODE_202_length_15324_cov_7.802627_6_plen_96_part_00